MLEEPEIIPPCTECGACCVGFNGIHVAKTDNVDPALISHKYKYQRKDVVRNPEDRWMKMYYEPTTGGPTRCCALTGLVGKNATCSIYATRPKACVDFPRGSDTCRLMRVSAGMLKPEDLTPVVDDWIHIQMHFLRGPKWPVPAEVQARRDAQELGWKEQVTIRQELAELTTDDDGCITEESLS